jgi:predicted small secreted protein
MRILPLVAITLAAATGLAACNTTSGYSSGYGNDRYVGPREACERDRANDKVAGTVAGAVVGALAGGAIAGNSSNTAGVVGGAVVGGAVGNAASGRTNC